MCPPFHERVFEKKRDEEEMKMKMKMREREREIFAGGSFFKQCFFARRQKKKSLSPLSLPKSKVDAIIILQNLFFCA